MNLFVVNTPLQLINAVEAKRHFDIRDEDSLLIVIYLEQRIMQMRESVEESEWAEVIWLESDEQALHRKNVTACTKIFNWISGCLTFRKQVSGIQERWRKFSRVFLGNFLMTSQLHLANCSPFNDLILLDDGNATFEVAKLRNEFKSPLAIHRTIWGKVNYLIKQYIFKYRLNRIATVTFFTIYDLKVSEQDRIENNTFRYLRTSVSMKTHNAEIWFIGAPLVEQSIVSLSDFCSLIDKVVEYYKGRKILYILHPAENIMATKNYLEHLGVETIKFSLPLEMVFLKKQEMPALLATFYSSAIYNLRLILGEEIECNSFRIGDNILSKQLSSKINNVYDQYEAMIGSKFKVIKLLL
ncbi:MAG: hypothetical protein KGZ62_10430 [Sulfurimonas sp.]|nr:hypothetical protein [Sulfurimonas sp.]